MKCIPSGRFLPGVEVAIATLGVEEQFIAPVVHVMVADGEEWTEWYWGFVVDQCAGSVVVDLTSPRQERTRWAQETPVIPLSAIKENEMTPNPAVANLIGRYKFQVIQLATGDESKQNTAVERLPKILKESVEKGIPLPAPSTFGHEAIEAHELFEGFKFGEAQAPKSKAAKADAKDAERVAAKAEADGQKVEGTAPKAKAVKKSNEPHPCLCNCGAVLTGKGSFAPGHDAKLKSRLLRFERGEIGAEEAIGAAAAGLVEYKNGELVVEKDKDGAVKKETQQYVVTKSPVKLPGR